MVGQGAVFEAPALVVGLDDVAVVSKTIERQSRGHLRSPDIGDATTLDRRVAEVRVVDPHRCMAAAFRSANDALAEGFADRHPAAGRREPSDLPCSHHRSPSSVRKSDGGCESSGTHFGAAMALPLANHVRAVLASRNADLSAAADATSIGCSPSRTAARTAATPVAAALVETRRQLAQRSWTARVTFAAAVRRVRGEELSLLEHGRCRLMNASRPLIAPSWRMCASGNTARAGSVIIKKARSCSIGWSSEPPCSAGHASEFTSSMTISGKSGTFSEDRYGFQTLIAEVGLAALLPDEPLDVFACPQQPGLASAPRAVLAVRRP